MSFFNFRTETNIDFSLGNLAGRAYREIPSTDGSAPQRIYVFSSGEDIYGDLKINVMGGKRIEHSGIKIEIRGVVELASDKNPHELVSIIQDVAPAGTISGTGAIPFKFSHPQFPFDTYNGKNARIKYVIRAIVSRNGYGSNAITKDYDFIVQNITDPPEDVVVNKEAGVKLEVGIEDCLHIEFEYDKTRFHLHEFVTGYVDFLLVRIKLKHMEVAVIRKEASGFAPNVNQVSETLTRYEIMDGCPVKGERIPLRLALAGLDLCPSINSAAGCLTVRYFLNLVLVDEEDHRYFKQQEISLYRAAVRGDNFLDRDIHQ